MKGSDKDIARVFVESTANASKAEVESAAEQLIKMLADSNETHRVRAIVEAIEGVWKEKYGAATITIETAHPLTSALKQKLESIAPGAELKEKVRKEVIGGARLRVDDTIVDGSIEGHLENLNQAFRNA